MQVRYLGRQPYLETQKAMQDWTQSRTPETPDELWLLEHDPVFTQGVAGQAKHLLNPGSIPVVASNRGGQITYHGPGQVVAYPLIDLRRLHIFVKEYVYRLEASVLAVLGHWGVTGHRVSGAPGIYVRISDPFGHASLPRSQGQAPNFDGLGKIAALGIKVSQHCTYHGLALNVNMNLEPFNHINPCGYGGLRTLDLASLGINTTCAEVMQILVPQLHAHLSPYPSHS